MSDRYQQPEEGYEDWGDALNENFADIGSDIENLESSDSSTGDLEWPDTVYVPSDYDTIDDALDALGELPARLGESITIMIESGHEIQTYTAHTQANYRTVTIASEDDTVHLASGVDDRNIFQFQHYSVAPRFDIFVDGHGHGQRCWQINFNSNVHLDEGAGCRDFDYGLGVQQNSRGYVEGGEFTDCTRGIHCANNSLLQAHNTNVSGSSEYGFRTSASRLDLIQCDATDCDDNGVRCMQGGVLNARAIDVSGSGIGISNTLMGDVTAEDATIEDCSIGVRSTGLSRSMLTGASFGGNSNNDIEVEDFGLAVTDTSVSTNVSTGSIHDAGIIIEA